MLAAVARLFDPWFARGGTIAVLQLLAQFVFVWTVFNTVSFSSVALHTDMVEVYGWGLNLDWGFAKHPPLGAAMARAWFTLFPATDWAFNLLAMVNAAAGLFFVDLIARRYVSGDKRLLVLLLLLLTPFYQFLSQRFASNQTLLLTWPLATWCFLRAFETRTVAWSIAAGAAAALAMLGKYYSVFLLVGFVVAALAHPARARYLRSASPWISVAAGLAALLPHLHWLIATGFQPFGYALGAHAGASAGAVIWSAVQYLVGSVLYVVLPAAIVLVLARPDRATLREMLWPSDPDRRMLAVLLYVPLVLPVLVALPLGAQLPPLWSMQGWFLLPVLLLAPAGVRISRAGAVGVAAAVAISAVVALGAARLLAGSYFRGTYGDGRLYIRQLAQEVTREWHDTVRAPLRIVAADGDSAYGIAFYSPDHPSPFHGFNIAEAPWLSPDSLARDGYAIACAVTNSFCMNELAQRAAGNPAATRREVEIVPTWLGRRGAPARYAIAVLPPGS